MLWLFLGICWCVLVKGEGAVCFLCDNIDVVVPGQFTNSIDMFVCVV